MREKISHENNKGFSFIELLISIAILAIIMIPLLRNFITAAKVNDKMDKLSSVEAVATNLMEEIKNIGPQNVEEQFQPGETFSLLPIQIGTGKDAESILKDNVEDTLKICQLKIGGSKYDVVIDVKDATDAGQNKNPIMQQLDSQAVFTTDTVQMNGVAIDDSALAEFVRRNNNYVNEYNWAQNQNYEADLAAHNADPAGIAMPTVPVYASAIDISILQDAIQKKITIKSVQVDEENYQETIEAEYILDNSYVSKMSPADGCYKTVMSRTFKKKPGYVYVYYTPTIFQGKQEVIHITDDELIAYVIKQTDTPCNITITGADNNSTMYSNLLDDSGAHIEHFHKSFNTKDGIENEDVKRIYSIDIIIKKGEATVYHVSSTGVTE